MFDSETKYVGRQYTGTFAWIAAAVIFIPGMIFVLRPGYVALSLALVSSIACLILARASWRKSSQASIAAMAAQQVGRND